MNTYDSRMKGHEATPNLEPDSEWKHDLAVVGMGYVGMPLAQQAMKAGLRVLGYDLNSAVASGLAGGHSHIDDINDDDLRDMLRRGFEVTSEPAALSGCEVICVCVPTPLSGEGGPDLSAVLAAAETVQKQMTEGCLVVFESTTYPGSTEEDAKPILEAAGRVAGRDFNLAFSPERVDPGNPTYGIGNTPKVVGGLTKSCTERAVGHYSRFIDRVVPAKGIREAEMSKLLENTYRHVNIALVNEIAKFSHELGIDIWNVIACASTKPFGFQPFYPGPGVGGHCIPIDPNYLSYKVQAELGYRFRFVELAQEINHGMPAYVVQRCADLLNNQYKSVAGARILLLGVTYKPDIADLRESPASPIARELLRRGAELSFHDFYCEKWQVDGTPVRQIEDLRREMKEADLTVLLQAHARYLSQDIASHARLLFDTRGKLQPVRGATL